MSGIRPPTLLAIAALSMFPLSSAAAADVTAASCTQPDVQAAIDMAADGSRVLIPAGNCTWSTNVGWQNKNIHVKGAGIDQTTITRGGDYVFYVSASVGGKAQFRISDMTLTGNTTAAAINITTETYAGIASGWRVDHIKFNYPTGQRRGVTVRGATYGVIDHNQFLWSQGVAVGVAAFNASDSCSASNPEGNYLSAQPLDLGTVNAIYIEDNSFTSSGTGGMIVYDDSAGGARTVFRHNTVTGGFFYSHWTRGCEIGGMLHEIYNNTFNGNADYNDYPIRLEAGTGVIFNNTVKSYQQFPPYVVFDERRPIGAGETSTPLGACDGAQAWDGNLNDPAAPGWPCLGQIGRSTGKSVSAIMAGDKPGSAPIYLWNNGTDSGCATGGTCTDVVTVWATPAGYIKSTPHPNGDVDYVMNGKTPKPGYTPFVYPHPLVSGSSSATVVPPTNLRVVAIR